MSAQSGLEGVALPWLVAVRSHQNTYPDPSPQPHRIAQRGQEILGLWF